MKASEEPKEPSEADEAESGTWVRARRPEHKQERREAILEAAVILVDAQGVANTSLSAIAREAGISKAAIYRYFESREAILLRVVLDDAEAWTAELEDRLEALAEQPADDPLTACAEIFASSTAARPRLCMLVASMSAVLERNVSAEFIAEFKREFNADIARVLVALGKALPALTPDDARVFVTFFYVFTAGAYPMAHPPPVVTEVLEREEFSAMALEFEPALQAHAQTVLRGLLGARSQVSRRHPRVDP